MGILMAGLSPHPPIIIEEIGGERRSEVKKTTDSLRELSREVKERDPDILITISPHGPVFTDAISILDQRVSRGDFSDFGYPEIHFEVETHQEFISQLKTNAALEEIEVITLTSAELERYNVPDRLDHGVLVPLSFILEAGVDTPLVPITMGLLDYRQLYQFGQVIQKTLTLMELDAVIIASGDLSHRLKPGAPAGFNPRGKEFDRLLLKNIKNGDYQQLLEMDPQLIEKAGECGLRPVIIMLGAIQALSFQAEIKSYEGPFGVGYGVVGFYPEEEIK